MSKKKTKEEFIEESNIVHNNKYDYSKVNYINNRTKVCIICPEHGEFWQIPHKHILSKNGCPYCSSTLKGCNESFIEKAKMVHGDKYDYSNVDYVNNRNNVCIICPEHGEFWQTPHNHLQGKGCPECAKPLMRNAVLIGLDEFIKRSKEHHGDKYDYSNVDLSNRDEHGNVCIICPEHGEFWQKPFLHMSGFGCKKCSSSHLENEIMNLLTCENIEFIHQCDKNIFPWLGRMRFDFYLPKYNVVIECQGIQHFEPIDFAGKGKKWAECNFKKIVKNDNLKKELCTEHKISLLYFSNLEYSDIITNKEILLKKINEQKTKL